jgi:resuscitation-promoting factor RpfB
MSKGGGLALGAAVIIGLSMASGAHGGKHHGGIGAVLDSLTAAPAGATTASANERLGMRMAAAAGWGTGQRQCLDWLWTRESGWNPYAANPTSDARGIPQDINGWSAFGPGDVRAQVAWGIKYIRGRYGTPCAAWAHETQMDWY